MPISPRVLYQVKIVGELHGQLTETRFWLRGGDASPASTVTAEISGIRQGFINLIIPAFRNFVSSAWHGNHMLTVQMSTRPGVFVDEVLAISGVQDADSLPSYCAGVLSLRTGLTGRSRVGRLYIPGVASSDQFQSRLSGPAFGQLQSLGDTLLSTFGPTGSNAYGRIGVFSRKLGVTRNPGPPPFLTYSTAGWTQVTQFIARPVVGTQRKRLLGWGQ